MDAAGRAVIEFGGSGMWRCNIFTEEHAMIGFVNCFLRSHPQRRNGCC